MSACGKSFCNTRHRTTVRRRMHGCAHRWHSARSTGAQIVAHLYPSGGVGGNRGVVYVGLVGTYRARWAHMPSGMIGFDGWYDTSDVRSLGESLIAMADYADERTALLDAQASAQAL